MIVGLILILSIVIPGIYASYTDIKKSKIKNKCILSIFLLGIVINLILTKSFFLFPVKSAINLFFSFGIAFLLWNLNVWSSGDAKLFMAYSTLLPVYIYEFGYVDYFPAISLLINAFVPATGILLLLFLPNLKVKHLKKTIKQILKPSKLVNQSFLIFGLSFISNLLFSLTNVSGYIISVFVLLTTFKIMNKYLSKNIKVMIFSVLFILNLLIFNEKVLTKVFLLNFVKLIIGFQFVRVLLTYSGEVLFTKKKRIEELEPRMVLGEKIVEVESKEGNEKGNEERTEKKNEENNEKDVKDKKEIKYEKKPYKGGTSLFQFKNISSLRLTEEKIKELKKLQKEGKLGFDEVKIINLVPFAPILLTSTLITYFFRGNLFFFIYFWLTL